MTLFLLVLGFMALAMLVMAIGVIFKRPCLRGSCGGPEVMGVRRRPYLLPTCPNRTRV